MRALKGAGASSFHQDGGLWQHQDATSESRRPRTVQSDTERASESFPDVVKTPGSPGSPWHPESLTPALSSVSTWGLGLSVPMEGRQQQQEGRVFVESWHQLGAQAERLRAVCDSGKTPQDPSESTDKDFVWDEGQRMWAPVDKTCTVLGEAQAILKSLPSSRRAAEGCGIQQQ